MPGAHVGADPTMRDRSAAEKLKQRQAELGALTGGEDGSKDDDGPDIKFVEMIDEGFGVRHRGCATRNRAGSTSRADRRRRTPS